MRPECDLRCRCVVGGQWLVDFVLARFQRKIGLLRPEYGGLGARVQEARGFHFLVTRQVLEARQAEMLEEEIGRAPRHRTARHAAAAHRPDPVRLEQQVERALAETDAAHLFDLGAGDGLVIGDDGQCFDRRLGQALLFGLLLAQQEGQVAGGAELVFSRNSAKGDG